MKWARHLLIGGGGLFTLVSLSVLGSRTYVNPPVDPLRSLDSMLEMPSGVSVMLRRSCYDCHSHLTRWPWYSRIPPLSTIIADDVRRARQRMNFSEWPTEGPKAAMAGVLLMAGCASMREGIMPPNRYVHLHPGSRPSKEEVDAFCAWSAQAAAQLARERREAGKKQDQERTPGVN